MGVFSDNIRASMALNFVSGRKNTAANARAVVGTIADAVATLEGLQRGASILSGAGVPANATGNDGDAYINTTVSDFYLKSNGTWGLRLVLRGNDGASAYQSWLKVGNVGSELAFVLSLRGQDGRSAYQSWQAAGNVGSEVQFVASLAGRSAYQSWQAAGNVGTEAQFVASLQAKQGDPGERGNRITANATAPNSGGVLGEAGDLEVIGAGTTFTDRIPGDLHFQTLSADRFRLWYQDRGTWVSLYTTPAGATVADGSITNEKLATDVKAGSLSAARIAFPAADRVNLNSFTDMVAWCASGITNMIQGLAALTTRVKTLEDRPISSGGSGGSGFTPATAGDGTSFLSNDGTYRKVSAGGAGTVKTVNGNSPDATGNVNTNQKYAADYALGQVGAPPPIDFRVATQLTLIAKTTSIATVSYAINNATPQPFLFTNGIDARPISIPAGGQLVLSGITYVAGFTAGTIFLEGSQA